MAENRRVDIAQSLDWLEKSSVKSKDYYKFVIGLSTGTLIFSLTFFKEFLKFPQF